MKKQFLVLVIIAISFIGYAQPWSVNPAEFEFTMNIVGQVSILGTIEDDASNYIGAFVDDVCVGVCSPIEDEGEFKLFYLTVYSNQSSGEIVEFKFVDESENETLISNTVVFESDGIIGDADSPFIWFDTEEYASTDILEFTIEEQVSTAEINSTSKTISVLVEHGTIVNNLIPSFVLAPGASAEVNSIEQESGVTANDYSSDVIYVVTGADQSTANWTVSVTVDNSDVAQFDYENISVYPNPNAGQLFFDGVEDNVRIEIYNLAGQMMCETYCDFDFSIYISDYPAGTYVVRINHANSNMIIKRIVKE
ncbi:MAG: T9SS type A sorting domain-containing protein [Bacteroidales bacterium]|nr:T9SS type A sorting domain-containing protein [Bacteroidales bacterium]